MELPKYHETFIPVLEVLNSVESLKSRELASKVRDVYYSHLPKQLLEQKRAQEQTSFLIEFYGENLI